MSVEVKVPQLPESVSDATLVAWHKAVGDDVALDENLVDLETDKVVLEVPSPVAGSVVEIRIENGATVTSGEVLAVLEPGAGRSEGPDRKEAEEPAAAVVPPPVPPDAPRPALKLSPAVRRLVDEHDIDPEELRGSGKDGRVTKRDVMQYLERRGEMSGELEASEPPPAEDPIPSAGGRQDRRVAMSRLRTRIAERMVEAQQTAAMLTTFNEVDLSEIIRLRKTYRDEFENRHGVRLGFMGFFVRASIEALRRFPIVNASVEDKDIVYHDYFDIGIAVSSERGLVVPVIRDAGDMSLGAIEKAINDYGEKARSGGLTIDDLTGGTFTISNGGVFGSMLSTPILNPPQSGILGMHKIEERPVVVDGEIVVRPMMYLALSYDHRIIDGRDAVQFLVAVRSCLEDPARFLLDI